MADTRGGYKARAGSDRADARTNRAVQVRPTQDSRARRGRSGGASGSGGSPGGGGRSGGSSGGMSGTGGGLARWVPQRLARWIWTIGCKTPIRTSKTRISAIRIGGAAAAPGHKGASSEQTGLRGYGRWRLLAPLRARRSILPTDIRS